MDTLEAMRAFVKVAEAGSFTEAARRLSVAPPIVSRAVQALEARVGTRLFHRTTRRVSLTEAGQRYLGTAAHALVELEELEASLRGEAHGEVSGTLRLTMPVSLGVRYLVPLLADFQALHPRVKLDLDFCDHLVDPVARGFDAAFRVSTMLDDSALAMRRIAACPVVLAAAPAYLDRAGAPASLEALGDHPLLEVAAARGRPSAAAGAPVRANSVEALKGFATAGLGVIRAPAFAVADDLEAGRLVRLLPHADLGEYVVSVVFAQRALMPVRLRRLIDHVAQGMAGFPAPAAAATPRTRH